MEWHVATATGGTTPYSFVWDNGQWMGATVGTLTPGLHTVVVTDANGCSASDTVVITEPTQLEVIIDDSQTVLPYCIGVNSGQLCAQASGGTPAYQYLWNDGLNQTTACAYNLQADQYTVVVMDDRNCIATASFDLDSITNSMNAQAVSLIQYTGGNDISCFGENDGEVAVNVWGGYAPYNYQWYGPNNFASTNDTISNLLSGGYSVTISDTNNCMINYSIVITEPDQLLYTTYNVIDESILGACDGQIWVNVTGGTCNYYYDVSEVGNFPIVSANQVQLINDSLIYNLCAGSHSIYITDDNNCQGSVFWGGTWVENIAPGLTLGCMDSLALNYDPNATMDDGSCLFCNINTTVTIMNETQTGACDGFVFANSTSSYPPVNYYWLDINGTAIAFGTNSVSNLCSGTYYLYSYDINCVSIDTFIIENLYGCTDPTASNYDPYSLTDNGTCIYLGCTDSLAFNYDTMANTDDGSCQYCDLSISLMVMQESSPSACDGWVYVNASSSNTPIYYLWSSGSTANNIVGLCSGTYTLSVTDAVGCIIDTTIIIGSPAIYGCTDPLLITMMLQLLMMMVLVLILLYVMKMPQQVCLLMVLFILERLSIGIT